MYTFCYIKYMTICLAILLLMDILAVAVFWLLWKMQLWTFLSMSCGSKKHTFLICVYLGTELLMGVYLGISPGCILRHRITVIHLHAFSILYDHWLLWSCFISVPGWVRCLSSMLPWHPAYTWIYNAFITEKKRIANFHSESVLPHMVASSHVWLKPLKLILFY